MRTARKVIDGKVYEFELVDIWSRPGDWSRQRAYLFLGANFVVYAAMNVFFYWHHQARLFDFSWSSYTVTYHKTLIDFLFFPIRIHEAPVLILILGMLMATMVVVPILIAQLYGFRYSIIFCLCVLLFAHLPVLSVFLVASSFIAGVSKRRLPFKFGVAILSLVPIAVYFWVATRGAQMLEYRIVDPTLLYAPWFLAFLAAAVIAAVVLGFARLVTYRPGGILVAMIPFFAIPVVLFYKYVGPDQIEYRILVHRFGPSSPIYSPTDISGRVFQETLKKWRRYKVRDLQAIVDVAAREFPYIAQQRVQEDRARILAVCESFEKKYPKSRFVPNALYIMGMAQDLRYDYQVLLKKWTVEYTTDLVSPQSRGTWLRLVEEYPNSVYAQPARFRLAVLSLRDGQIPPARAYLRDLLAVTPSPADTGPTTRSSDLPTSLQELFTSPRQTDTPTVNLTVLVDRAQELLELVESNGEDPKFGFQPLIEYLKLDPGHPAYRDHLLDMAIKYNGSVYHDNLLVWYALTDPGPRQRKVLLQRYSENLIGKDGGARALYELGTLLQAMGLVEVQPQARKKNNDEADQYFHLLIQKYPKSIFSVRAQANLRRLESSQP